MELFLLTMKRLLFLGFLLLVAGSGALSKPQASTIKNNDVNECLTKLICGPNEECANRSGSFRCECRLGFESKHTKDKIECDDQDECKEENICGNNSVCNNTFGSYSCQCKPGYKANSVNFTAAQGGPCRDINECEGNAVICGPNAMCDNSIGSYHCECISGFVASNGQERFNTSQNVTCDDINECLTKPICGPDATCVNSIGSYHCECNSGFMEHFNASQNVTCEDINECLTEPSCGHHATCLNSIGSYHCECDLGFVASTGQERFNKSQNIICNELKCNRLDRGNFPVQTPVEILQILDELKSTCMQKGVSGEEMLQILIDALESFREKTSFTESETVTAMFQLVEATLLLIGQLLVNNKISQSFPQTRVEMLVKRQPSTPQGTFTLSTNAIQFSSHWDNAVGESYPGFAAACLFEYADMKIPHVNSIISNDVHKTNSRTDRFELNSRIVTIKVTNPNTARLMKPVTLQFSHLKEAVQDVICVFWDSALEGGVWSNKGCIVVKTNINYTVCSCDHLSSFAVLMALYEQKNVFELQLITWIGLGLSLICLLICILTFWLVRSIQSTRTIIHLHLCVSLFIADFIFLVGISQTENKAGCAVVAGLLHYFFLAVFCWMSLEGIQLFRMVVLVFNTTLNRGYLMAAGYGVPALIVIVSATANYKGYGTPRYCWLNLESGFIWSFFAPVCIIIVVNAIFFLITVSKLAQKFNSLNPDVNNLRKIKTFTITAIAQLCVLGTMWIFGCFQFDEGTLVMSYLFTILNSFQGVLVFIMHCLLSKQVRDEYIRFLTCLTTRQKSSYSEFSTNQSSKSQTSKNSQNTGESKI